MCCALWKMRSFKSRRWNLGQKPEQHSKRQLRQVAVLDQIAKSVIFAGQTSGQAILFITAGGNQVDPVKASAVAGEPLGKADAALIRAQTGFAIGGVAPIGHLHPITAYLDPRLTEFDVIYAAAGTPRHIFPIIPKVLLKISNSQVSDFTI